MNRRIHTENGWVVGLPASDPRITSFKGIPFAAPPVGENRWRAPQPCESWEGDRLCHEFGPIGMQDKGKPGRNNFWSREWAVDFDLPMSEDCLYLNIWAPADGYPVGVGDQYRETEEETLPKPGNLPVYVWFFGGGLQVGNTAEMEFDGERIARRGIVMVTVSYRLNVFGFLAHPELTRECPDVPCNFGLLDQQYAMKWVKRNIAAFGGNPENITIGGQSSGGMAVCTHLANPENRGLFRKAILESAIFFPAYSDGSFFRTDLAKAEKNGQALFEALGVKNLAEARALDADKLLEAAVRMPPHSFDATIEGKYMKGPANEWFLQEGHLECPIFLSCTDIELQISPRGVTDSAGLRKLAESLDGVDVDRFMKAFGGADDPEAIQVRGVVPAIELAAHAINRMTDCPMWLARFSAEIPGWDHPGAFHSSDIWFYFETLSKCWRPFTGKHYDLARQMCDYWANFIRSGDPNGRGTDWQQLPEWPRLEEGKPVRMGFGETASLEDGSLNEITEVLLDAFIRTHS